MGQNSLKAEHTLILRFQKGSKIEKFQEITRFKFFTSTRIHFEGSNKEPIKVGVPLKNLFQEKNRGGLGLRSALNIGRSSNFSNGRMDVLLGLTVIICR